MKLLAICTVNDRDNIQSFLDSCTSVIHAYWFIYTQHNEDTRKILQTFLETRVGCISESDEGIQDYVSSIGWKPFETYILSVETHMKLEFTGSFECTESAYRVLETTGPLDSYPVRIRHLSREPEERIQRLNGLIIHVPVYRERFDSKDVFELAREYETIDREKSLMYYLKRIEMGGNDEQVYYSMIRAGDLSKEEAQLDLYIKAKQLKPTRMEAYYRLGLYYKHRSKNDLASLFLTQGRKYSYPEDDHFYIERDVYDYKLDEELSICCYYVPEYASYGSDACERLVLSTKIPKGLTTQSYNNQFYYINKLPFSYKTVMNLSENSVMKCSSSSLVHMGQDRFLGIQRQVNYSIRRENGSYIIRHPKNHLVTENILYEKVGDMIRELGKLTTNVPKRRESHIEGIEDMRLFMYNNQLYAFGTTFEWGLNNHPSQVLCKIEGTTITSIVPILYRHQHTQKNWCPFVYNEKICFIYSYNPLRILEVNEETGECRVVIEKTFFINTEKWRGSTSPIWTGNEYVIISHEIHEKHIRHYFHRLIHFDRDWNIRKVSKPFYLEEKQIEYILGFAPYEDAGKYLIHYSIFDNSSNLITVRVPDDFEYTVYAPVSESNTTLEKVCQKTTIVSAFIDLNAYDMAKRLSTKSIDFYVEQASNLVRLPYNKIIFIEKKNIEIFKEFENEYTTFVPFEKEEMYFWNEREKILKTHLPSQHNKEKDTHDYMMVQIQKSDWIRRAIELNPYKTDQFTWVDIGIYWIMKNQKTEFERSIGTMVTKEYNKLRIAGCWDMRYFKMSEPYLYNAILWFFLGGVFGGSSTYLLKFDELVKKYAKETLEKGRWIWEVNIYYLIYKYHPEIFDIYKADHNMLIIKGY